MTKNTYRFIILLLTALLFLVIWWGVSFSQNNNQEIELPDAIENIYPLPYDQVPQQVSLEIDFPVGYELTLIVITTLFQRKKFNMLKQLVYIFGNLVQIKLLKHGVQENIT